MERGKRRKTVFERTQKDEEKLAQAIIDLESIDFNLSKLQKEIQLSEEQKNCYDESINLLHETLEYLRGIEIKNEIESYSHFDDIDPGKI